MGARGPAKTPSALVIARGNPGHRPPKATEPKHEASLGTPPRPLAPQAQAYWDRIAPMLRSTRLLTVADEDALCGLCELEAWSEYWSERMRRGIEGGADTRDLRAFSKSHSECQANLRQARRAFGLDPSSRASLHVPNQEADIANDVEGLLVKFRNRCKKGAAANE